MKRAVYSLLVTIPLAFAWPCAFPDGKGNPYIPYQLPPGEPQIAWSADIGKPPTSVAVSEDRVFLGASNLALCYDMTTGKQAWSTAFKAEITAPPAVFKGRVIFCDATGNIISFDQFTGEIKDRYSLGAKITAPPIIAEDDLFIVSSSGKLARLTPDLKEKMTADLASPLLTSPIVASSGLYQITHDGTIYTLDQTTGKLIGSKKTLPPTCSPCFADGLLNAPNSGGVVRWKGDQQFPINLPSQVSCIVAIPGSFLICGTKTGLYAIDGDKVVWTVSTAKPVTALCSNNEMVVAGTQDGKLQAIRIKDGSKLWEIGLSGEVRHPIAMMQSGLVAVAGTQVVYLQLWDLNPEPPTVDLGHIPTGETATGQFSMSNPTNSSSPVQVICSTEMPEMTIYPQSAIILQGQKTFFTITLNTNGMKEGQYKQSVTVKTKTSSYKVTVTFWIVPQPFVATLVIGDKIMKMKRGTQSWDVELEQPPFLMQNRTMVPLRAISESFGPKVTYVKDGCAKSSRVDITLGGTIINHCIGSNLLTLRLPGQTPQTKTFDTPSVIKGGRTFVPIRFIAEAFNANVVWDSASKTVIITYQPQ